MGLSRQSPLQVVRTPCVLAVTIVAAVMVGTTTATSTASPPAADPDTASVRLIGFNDFHGNLEPPTGFNGSIGLSDGKTRVPAGGAAYLATHLARLRAEVTDSLVLASGDNIGASPLASALFHDEPTIELFDKLGVNASAIGNHELDHGYQELLRKQFGGCHPKDGCQFHDNFGGAHWPYLAANMTFEHTSVPAALPFSVTFAGGVPIGIIGVPLHELPTVVSAEGIKGLEFGDEVEAINRTADVLDELGVKSMVVVMHQGDFPQGGGGPNDCRNVSGPARGIAMKVSPKIDVIFTGHSHQQYVCQVPDPEGAPRPVLQAASYGRILSVVDLKVDRNTGRVKRSETKAFNNVVTRDVPPDPDVQALVDEAVTKAAPIANRAVGTITADITRTSGESGESPLGNLTADAQLESTTGASAQIALMNPGGIRTDLIYNSAAGPGVVTYGKAFEVQPFSNILQTLTYTGDQLKAVLEQQWSRQPDGSTRVRMLQPSAALNYTWSASAPIGSKVSNITIGGQSVQPSATYRVTVNNFLAGGGDGFTELRNGTAITGGAIDIDAFVAYLGAHPNVAPPATNRIITVP